GQHPLEGTITRALVVDLHEGGGYEVLTTGTGHGGAALPTTIGQIAAGPLGAVIAQNASHFINPGLGDTAFSMLNDAMVARANGTANPNLDAPNGPHVELGGILQAAYDGAKSLIGHGPDPTTFSLQTQTLAALGQQLNAEGGVEGKFMRSADLPG